MGRANEVLVLKLRWDRRSFFVVCQLSPCGEMTGHETRWPVPPDPAPPALRYSGGSPCSLRGSTGISSAIDSPNCWPPSACREPASWISPSRIPPAPGWNTPSSCAASSMIRPCCATIRCPRDPSKHVRPSRITTGSAALLLNPAASCSRPALAKPTRTCSSCSPTQATRCWCRVLPIRSSSTWPKWNRSRCASTRSNTTPDGRSTWTRWQVPSPRAPALWCW